ncbi:type VII secretion-associated serine protease mycosin [Haloechinothrix sp. LS1_15]|nr:type VII secretion-associated serine protease mycosin [Haloechinothrix sp. LS1_15]
MPPLLSASATAVADERPEWAPPPPSGSPPDDNNGEPDQRYTQRQECVERAELDDDVSLPNIPWGQMHLRIDDVHSYVKQHADSIGDGMGVAVIDTGVTEHPYLDGRVHDGGDYVLGEDGLHDCDGHGTQVAGIIAADPDDPNIGFTGVAPDAEIVSIRQSSQNYSPETEDEAEQRRLREEAEEDDDNGDEDNGDTEPDAVSPGTVPSQDDGAPRVLGEEGAGDLRTLAQAVRRAADTDGVEVINMSVDNCRSADGPEITSKERELQAAVRYAVDNDIVVVAAAGNVSEACEQNDQPNPLAPRTIVSPPWFSEDLLAVAAIDRTGGVAQFSMNGPWVSVAAPGTEIISLDPAEGAEHLANLTIEGGEAVELQGTSFAAPYVAGLAVLVRQMHPDLDAREVMHRIKHTAQHPGAHDGHDQFIGHGVVNPMAALTATVPEEEGITPASDVELASDVPQPGGPHPMAVTVALSGSAGALAALGITLFVVHTVRRSRAKNASATAGEVGSG